MVRSKRQSGAAGEGHRHRPDSIHLGNDRTLQGDDEPAPSCNTKGGGSSRRLRNHRAGLLVHTLAAVPLGRRAPRGADRIADRRTGGAPASIQREQILGRDQAGGSDLVHDCGVGRSHPVHPGAEGKRSRQSRSRRVRLSLPDPSPRLRGAFRSADRRLLRPGGLRLCELDHAGRWRLQLARPGAE